MHKFITCSKSINRDPNILFMFCVKKRSAEFLSNRQVQKEIMLMWNQSRKSAVINGLPLWIKKGWKGETIVKFHSMRISFILSVLVWACVSACVFSGCSGFLPQSKDMQVRWKKIQIASGCERECECVCLSECISPAIDWRPLQQCTPPLTRCMLVWAPAPNNPG